MSLLNNLLNGGFTVDVQLKSTAEFSDNTAVLQHLPKNAYVITLTSPEGVAAVKKIWPHFEINLEKVLEMLCERKFPDAKSYLAWKEFTGRVPVRIQTGAYENLGELLHTSLRKNIDTEVSAILWNAIGYLSPDDWGIIIEESEKSLRSFFTRGARPTRYEVAAAFAEAIKNAISECYHRNPSKRATRTEGQELALRMLYIGAQMSAPEDWAWGWLGFVLETVPLKTRTPRPIKKRDPARGTAIVKKTVKKA